MGAAAYVRLCWRRPLLSQWTCSQCRSFQSSTTLLSGHNRWSKIKHDKGKADAVKAKQRTIIAKEIINASRRRSNILLCVFEDSRAPLISSTVYGSDPVFNTRLVSAINSAKTAGFTKASIESAISRGQGRSSTGQALEALTVEAILPPFVACVIECQTDQKLRSLQDLRHLITNNGGTVTPTSYLFERKGKVTFEKVDGLGAEDILEQAIEAGATDVDVDEDGRVVVDSEPSDTMTVSQKLSEMAGLKVHTSEIIWDPNKDTLVEIESEEKAQRLQDLVEKIQEEPSVQDVYLNAS